MKLKRIKLIIFHPYSMVGGADKSISRLINGLSEKKYEIIFITLGEPSIKFYLKKKIRFIKIFSSKTIFAVPKIREFLKKIPLNEKVIFFSNQNFANIISFLILYDLKHIKQIIMERNHIDEFKYPNNKIDLIKKKIIKILMIILYKKADLILGNAKKLSEDLSTMINAKVKTLYNPAFDSDILKFSKKIIKNIDQKNIILNIGRLEIQKDQITILKAIKDIDEIFLIIIGYGSKKDLLNNFIKKNGLKKKVIILDKILNPYPYYKKCDLFVMSSLYEGFPNVLTEAAMFKLPIISSNCNSGPSEILLQNKGIQIFEKGNHEDLKKKINNFFKNKKSILNRRSLISRKLKRFDKKKIISQYDEIFTSIFN
tara:strand:+ start:1306 stop:2415 length:1110 start_codon:yes stop_codon:yes gene_type:complete